MTDLHVSTVVVDRGIGLVGDKMNVGCTRGVMAWEDREPLRNTVLIGLLDATNEGSVDIGSVGGFAIAASNYNNGSITAPHTEGQTSVMLTNSRVNTGSVGRPDIDVDIGDGLASRDVDEFNVEVGGNALLVLANVVADILAVDI